MFKQLQTAVSRHFGISIVRDASLYPWLARFQPNTSPPDLPVEAGKILRPDNLRLVELSQRYAQCPDDVTSGSVWTRDKIDAAMLRSFRGDNPYVFQQRMLFGNELAYALTYYYTLNSSAGGILRQLDEDGAFGAFCAEVDGRLISRDLLDAAGEIDFLVRHTGLGGRTTAMLDIGAGYGRLPLRVSEIWPDMRIAATDAFPASTFLSEFYLSYRKSSASVIPLHEIEEQLAQGGFQVATNVHSFSECKPPAIAWWVARIARARVRYLFVIPNRIDADCRCLTNQGVDMEAIFAEYGYRPIVRERRYDDDVVARWGVDPAQLVLFELASSTD